MFPVLREHVADQPLPLRADRRVVADVRELGVAAVLQGVVADGKLDTPHVRREHLEELAVVRLRVELAHRRDVTVGGDRRQVVLLEELLRGVDVVVQSGEDQTLDVVAGDHLLDRRHGDLRRQVVVARDQPDLLPAEDPADRLLVVRVEVGEPVLRGLNLRGRQAVFVDLLDGELTAVVDELADERADAGVDRDDADVDRLAAAGLLDVEAAAARRGQLIRRLAARREERGVQERARRDAGADLLGDVEELAPVHRRVPAFGARLFHAFFGVATLPAHAGVLAWLLE